MGEVGIDGVSPAVFGKYLAQHSMFPEENGVRYSKRHASSGSLVTLERIGDGGGNDTAMTASLRAGNSCHSRHSRHFLGRLLGGPDTFLWINLSP